MSTPRLKLHKLRALVYVHAPLHPQSRAGCLIHGRFYGIYWMNQWIHTPSVFPVKDPPGSRQSLEPAGLK